MQASFGALTEQRVLLLAVQHQLHAHHLWVVAARAQVVGELGARIFEALQVAAQRARLLEQSRQGALTQQLVEPSDPCACRLEIARA